MNGARISGKKLVLVGSLVLILIAASVRIFAQFYLRDQYLPSATQPSMTNQQPATRPSTAI